VLRIRAQTRAFSRRIPHFLLQPFNFPPLPSLQGFITELSEKFTDLATVRASNPYP